MNEKLDVNKILNDIESNFDVAKIKVNDFLLWPHIRYFLANTLLHNKSSKKPKKKRLTKLKLIKNSTYGFFNIFKKSDALFFSTSKERRFEGGLSISKNVNNIFKKYDKALLIEHAFDQMHFELKTVSEKNIISLSLLELLSKFLNKTRLIKLKLYGEEIIDSINQKYNINFNLLLNATIFISDYHSFRLFLKLKKPKILYITVWYGYGPVVKAAKDLGITTVEVQHGGFDKDHYSYNMNKIFDNTYYPEHILTFSKSHVDFLNRDELKKNNIFKARAVGSFLENKKKNLSVNNETFKKFKYIVSMSATINESQIEYDLLSRLSDQFIEVLFIYLPRRENEFKNKKNLKIMQKFTAPDYLPISDLHITAGSTCLYEAAFFEKKTLVYTPFIETEKFVINLKNKLKNYPSLYIFVDSEDDLITIINDKISKVNDGINDRVNINEIKKQNLYELGYEKNISNFIKEFS